MDSIAIASTRPKLVNPLKRLSVARRADREVLARQQRASLIKHREVISAGVRVDANNDGQLWLVRHAVHGCPSCRESDGLVGKGGQNSDETP